MRKMLLVISLAAISTLAALSANVVVSIDSIKLLQSSKEGQKVSNEIRKKIENFQQFVTKSQQDVAAMRQELGKQKKAGVLKKDVIEEKAQTIAARQKKIEREIADKEESLKLEVQRRQVKLRNKYVTLANRMCKENKWGMMIDKNTPGVLFVADSIDKTSEVLKRIDADFTPAEKKTVTVKNDKVAKPEVKRA